ncbi:MAG TPA: protein translocase subunit SecD [Acidimicrobiia bacterium]|nr:protein translocase subunit SecD [Acidimicrobiia bacterium]
MRRHVLQLTMAIAIVVIPLIAVFASNTTPQLGLDLQGGISVVLAPKAGVKVKSDTLGQAVKIIRSRVDSLGVAEPEISRQGNNIIIDLPGVKDRDKALQIVGQTAELRFRPVLQSLPPENTPVTTPPAAPGATTTTAAGATTTTAAGATSTTAKATTTTAKAAGSSSSTTVQKGTVLEPQATTTTAASATTATTAATATTATTAPATTPTTAPLTAGIIPTTPEDQDLPDKEVVLPIRKGSDNQGASRLALGPALMTGKDVKSASAQFQSEWTVHLSFTGDGFSTFNKIAAQYVGKQIAIVLDGVVQSYPVIKNAKFDTNDVVISGSFKEKEAKDLALVLRYGALPVPLERQTVQDVSPSLGKDQLQAGVVAGLIGLGLVALYMLVYYRLLGAVIWAGLLLSAGALYTLTSWLGSSIGLTLTLSGVTGIIVSVGITVDSYVVYFERLKDEVRSGKTIRSSLDRGFTRSFRTILAADLVSLIGAALLYFLAVGSVRGFAFFLGLSTLLDLFVAYFFMHPLVSIIGRKESFTRAGWLGIASGLDVKGATA